MKFSSTRLAWPARLPGASNRLAITELEASAPPAQVVVCVHGLSRNCRDFDYLARDLAHDGRFHLRYDPAIGDTLARMRALRPDTEVLELPGIGHAPALMSYDQIAAVKAFLLR